MDNNRSSINQFETFFFPRIFNRPFKRLNAFFLKTILVIKCKLFFALHCGWGSKCHHHHVFISAVPPLQAQMVKGKKIYDQSPFNTRFSFLWNSRNLEAHLTPEMHAQLSYRSSSWRCEDQISLHTSLSTRHLAGENK